MGVLEFNILQTHVDAGDRIAYYSQLDEWGYNYGELALGVVNNDTLGGATANNFFLLEAGQQGRLITADKLAEISLQLMRADFEARQDFLGSADGTELPVATIQTYHAIVFSDIAEVTGDAWTPNFALDLISDNDARENLWDELVDDDGVIFQAGNLVSGALADVLLPGGNPLEEVAAAQYLTQLGVASLAAAFSSSDDLGPYSIETGSGGFILGGGITVDALGIPTNQDTILGSNNNDVLLGFDGNDILLGGEGNDRLYGGEGSDLINGGEGDDIIGLEEADGDPDIIVVGQGFDWITGQGDAEDRIVLPTELLLPPGSISSEDEDESENEVILSQGSGAASSAGIPLLGPVPFFLEEGGGIVGFTSGGGFTPPDVPLIPTYPDFSTTTVIPEQIIPPDPDNPDEFEDTIIPPVYQGFVTFSVGYFTFLEMLESNPSVIEHYNLLGYINNPNSLFIQIQYFTNDGNSFEPHYVLIENFANGDFGIDLENLPVDGAFTPEQIDELTNNGDYIPIPEAPEVLQPDLNTGSQALNNPRIIGDREANLLEGDERDNTISGRNGDDELIGNAGNDILFAGSGDDILIGGTGSDRLSGGSGADNIIGGEGRDIAVYTQSDTGVIINLEIGVASGGDAEGDIISEIEDLVGSAFDDSLTGNSEDNRLVGNSGNDALFGGDGNDRLLGGEGSDQLIGGQGTDTAIYAQSDTGVIVNLATGTGVSGDANGDVLSEIENLVGSEFNDNLIGNNENNRLVGRDGDDTISGGAGNDRILGGEGDDLLTGGVGNDVFVYGAGFGADVIFDFEAGIGNGDRINLKALNINSFDDVLASATEQNGGVMLSFDEGSIFLEDLTIDQLHQNDFIL